MSASFNLTNELCSQRQLFLTYTSALQKTRTEVVSPYPTYTQEQLNMRRKVEILKYNNNRQPNLTNNFTKKKQWAQLNRTISSKSQTLEACPEVIQPTLTTSSDVPGPPIYLLEDINVPLYNYATVTNRQIPIVPDSAIETVPIISEVFSDVVANSSTIFTVCDLVIIDPVYSLTTFTFQTPVSLTITGTKTTSSSGKTPISFIKIQISNITYSTYYLGSPIKIADSRSLDVKFGGSLNNNFVKIDISNIGLGTFSASQYIDNLTVSSIGLITSPGMIYNLNLTFTLQYVLLGKNDNVIIDTPNVQDIVLTSTINLPDTNDPYYQSTSNCTLLSNTGSNFAPFSLSFQ